MKTLFPLLLLHFIFISGFGQSAVNRIDSLMKSLYQDNSPGAVIAIEHHHKIILKKGYGLTDIISQRPISADDNFNIGSLTKQFTAYALLDLYYKGKFSINDTIGKFFKLPAPLAGIRINHLLCHASGIPDHYNLTDTNKVKHATDKDVLVALQGADSLYFISGTRYRYSNTAYCLLGLLIEKLSGMTYPDYLQKQIFGPLGIRDATVFQINRPIPRRVTGYDLAKNGKFIRSDAGESIFFSTEADGGIYISMNNYMKWCEAIETGKFSHTNMIHYSWQGHTYIGTHRGLWYGCGWFIQKSNDGPPPGIIYHTGFNGGFRTVIFMIPSQEYCISMFSNRSDIDLEILVSRINNILSVDDNSFIKSGPLESFIHSWPIFAPCKETRSFSTSFKKNLNAKDMALN
ncbi:MAG TPA: serine hydrolase domain-containing protein [Puia sp.]|nr:serine hydrolase domain-containing protein [Puia sp.]